MSELLITNDNPQIKQTVHYGNEQITYQVFFSPNAKTKIIIDVLPNGTVHVKAPENFSLQSIKQAMYKRARWIHKHILKIKNQYTHVLPRHYVSGESHYYLGKRYVLKVYKSKTESQGVKLLRGQLQVYTPLKEADSIKPLLHDWYRQHAEITFSKRLEAITANISWLKTTPEFKLRLMIKQWGSCSPQGKLTLNPHLVKAPGECIDYVILHELCHLKEHNHSKQFYKLLNRHMPGWEAVKAKLDGMSELLLAE
ncbi:MAG: M48 family metallopeptidase [Gammaproteobacteria bacterium]